MHVADQDRQAIINWAARSQDIAEVWLYGSRARGDHHEESDIDLAIVTNGKDVAARQLIWMEAAWRNGLHLSNEVDLEWFDPEVEDWFEIVGPAVKQDGVLLYRRT
jgi:predicted nucleotidyltransferase